MTENTEALPAGVTQKEIAGGNGTVVTVKPKGFLVDDGKGCRLLKMDDAAIDTLIEKTGDLVHSITENV